MRNIPAQLLSHKQQEATTLCKIIKITSQDGDVIGMTTLDKNVTYNDGKGSLTYYAPVGFQPASIYESNGFEVNNSEFESLVVPEFDLGLDEFDVNAGKWDYSNFIVYEVNYTDLSQGHWVVMSGQLGQMKSYDGISLFGEMRSLSDLFRRNIVQLDSTTCRARFGSTSADERFPCGYNVNQLWINGSVTSVGVENNRIFTDTSRTEAEDFFVPGLLQFLTGRNAGKYIEIESNNAGEVTLSFSTSYAIQVGDTYRIRRDCTKRARDESKGCKHWFGNEWGLRFRGEPDIPIGDIGTLTTPQQR